MDRVRSLWLTDPASRLPPTAPDATLLDLTTVTADHEPARQSAAALIAAQHRLYLHVHPVASQQVRGDLLACLLPGVYGVSLPGLLSATQLRYVDSLLEEVEARAGIPVGLTALGGWIAGARALLEAAAIARASHRLTWVGIDGHALRAELGLEEGAEEALTYPRAFIAFAAQAAGLPAVDGPEPPSQGQAAARRHEAEVARRARALGLRGKLTRDLNVAAAFDEIFPATEEPAPPLQKPQ